MMVEARVREKKKTFSLNEVSLHAWGCFSRVYTFSYGEKLSLVPFPWCPSFLWFTFISELAGRTGKDSFKRLKSIQSPVSFTAVDMTHAHRSCCRAASHYFFFLFSHNKVLRGNIFREILLFAFLHTGTKHLRFLLLALNIVIVQKKTKRQPTLLKLIGLNLPLTPCDVITVINQRPFASHVIFHHL